MERRQFIEKATILAGGVLAAGSVSSAFAGETKAQKSTQNLVIQDKAILEKVLVAYRSLMGCLKSANLCAQHCQEQLAEGNVKFNECSTAVLQMIPVCDATAKLASMKSVRLKEILDACIASCQACKDACEEHKAHWAHGMHLTCKECAESCTQVIADCKKLQASLV